MVNDESDGVTIRLALFLQLYCVFSMYAIQVLLVLPHKNGFEPIGSL